MGALLLDGGIEVADKVFANTLFLENCQLKEVIVLWNGKKNTFFTHELLWRSFSSIGLDKLSATSVTRARATRRSTMDRIISTAQRFNRFRRIDWPKVSSHSIACACIHRSEHWIHSFNAWIESTSWIPWRYGVAINLFRILVSSLSGASWRSFVTVAQFARQQSNTGGCVWWFGHDKICHLFESKKWAQN